MTDRGLKGGEWPMLRRGRDRIAGLLIAASLALAGMEAWAGPACAERVLRVGFFHDYPPVSYSADRDPASAGFHEHRGYEADLLSALEAMGAVRLRRRAVGGAFAGIWLKAATPEYDLIAGGISAREDRTRDASGRKVVAFTAGHIFYTQTLLARAGDAGRIAGYASLTPEMRVGVFAGTTGEERLLQLTGYVDAAGALRAGVRAHLASGAVLEADGGPDLTVTAAGASEALHGRQRLEPPAGAGAMPQVVYFQDEAAQFAALDAGAIDAVAGGLVANADAARESGGKLAVAARDARSETGGFALALADGALRACLDERIAWLTDGMRIGYEDWRADANVFLRRAEAWSEKGG